MTKVKEESEEEQNKVDENEKQPRALSKTGIRVTSFPVGTNVFFTNPKSTGFNSAMIDILHSAEDI